MQEEIENRTVNLAISTTKLTARGIIRLAAKGLAYIKRKSHEAGVTADRRLCPDDDERHQGG